MRRLSDKDLRILLVASLALNFFGIGLLSAGMILGLEIPGLTDREHRSYRGLPPPRVLRAALPESDQPTLEKALDQHREDFRARYRELIGARQAVADAVRAEPFDAARLETALTDLRQRDSAVAVVVHRMLSSLIDQLSAESRSKVADTVRISHRHKHNEHDEREDRPRSGEGDR